MNLSLAILLLVCSISYAQTQGLNRGNVMCIVTCKSGGECNNRMFFEKEPENYCDTCVLETCVRSDTSDVVNMAACDMAARISCQSCPTVTNEARQQRYSCMQCLKSCPRAEQDNQDIERPRQNLRNRPAGTSNRGLSGSFPNGPRKPGQGEGNQQRRPGVLALGPGQNPCARSCVSQDQCPSPREIISNMQQESPECPQCISNTCEPVSNSSALPLCIREARMTCPGCSVPTAEDLTRLTMCSDCLAECSSDDMDGKAAEMFKPLFGRNGLFNGGSSGRNGPATYGVSGGHHGFGPRPSPCARSCVSEDKCATPREVMKNMQEERKECRECVAKTCAPVAKMGNRSALAKCIREARTTCTDCSVPTAEDVARLEKCTECLENCTADDLDTDDSNDDMFKSLFGPQMRFAGIAGRIGQFIGGNSGRNGPPQFGSPGRPGILQSVVAGRISALQSGSNGRRFPRFVKCMIECRMEGECRRHHRFDDDMSSKVGECRDCVRMQCGDIEGEERGEKMDCVIDARANCSACPGTPEEKSQLRKCARCVHRCVSKGDRPGSLPNIPHQKLDY